MEVAVKVSVEGFEEVEMTLKDICNAITMIYDDLPEGTRLSKDQIVEIIKKRVNLQ